MLIFSTVQLAYINVMFSNFSNEAVLNLPHLSFNILSKQFLSYCNGFSLSTQGILNHECLSFHIQHQFFSNIFVLCLFVPSTFLAATTPETVDSNLRSALEPVLVPLVRVCKLFLKLRWVSRAAQHSTSVTVHTSSCKINKIVLSIERSA